MRNSSQQTQIAHCVKPCGIYVMLQKCGAKRSFQVSVLVTPASIFFEDCIQSVVARSSFKRFIVVSVYHQCRGVEVNKDGKVHDVKYIWISTYSPFISQPYLSPWI